MPKKWKAGAFYELVDETGFLEHADVNKQLLPYVSGKFKVLELNSCNNVVSVENPDLCIKATRSWGVILVSEEREFFKRVKD